MDEQVTYRRKRSRSVGSVDSDAPDEYYVALSDLQESSGIADKSWSKAELSKISKISENMLSPEQEENIKKGFRDIFPTKEETEIKKLCDTMKINIVKELVKQEKAKMHASKKIKQLNSLLSLDLMQSPLSGGISTSSGLVDSVSNIEPFRIHSPSVHFSDTTVTSESIETAPTATGESDTTN